MKPYNKLFIILLTLLAVTLILSACRGDDPTTETEAPTVTDTPTEQPTEAPTVTDTPTEQPTEAPTEVETPEPETYYFVDNVAPVTVTTSALALCLIAT